jgi:hypothetical protein
MLPAPFLSLQVIFAAVVLFSMIGLPESPRFLISKDRIDEARYVLSQLNDCSMNEEVLMEEVLMVREANNRFSKQFTVRELFMPTKHQYLKRIIHGSSGQFFQQFTGIPLFFTIPSFFLVDRLGIRKHFLIGQEVKVPPSSLLSVVSIIPQRVLHLVCSCLLPSLPSPTTYALGLPT